MDQDGTWYGGKPWPRPYMLDEGPVAPKRGTALPIFGPCLLLLLWYRDGASNTVEENSSIFSLIRMC